MKISLPKLTALAFLLGCASASSQTLNWGSFAGSDIRDSEGEILDGDAFFFELGTFEEGFVPDETNVAQWLDNWRVFDSATLGAGDEPGTSQFTKSSVIQGSPHESDYVSKFQGLQAYIWIREKGNTEYFLTSSTQWSFPTVEECCPTSVHSWSVGITSSDVPIWGAKNGNHYGGEYSSPGPYEIQTHAVPEAGSSLLALLAGGMAVFLRRRTSSR